MRIAMPRFNLWILVGLFLISVAKLTSQEPTNDGLPSSFDVKKIEKDAPNSGNPERFYVLAWHESKWKYDGTVRHWQKCLAIRSLPSGKYQVYHLVCRNSKDNPGWSLEMVHAIGEPGLPGKWYWSSKQFDSRPSNKVIYESLSTLELNWDFGRRADCVGCGVCKQTWKNVIGEEPSRFFPDETLPPPPK